MFVDFDDYKCEKCGSSNYRYTHDFNPENPHNSTIIKVTCLDCGHTIYPEEIRINEKNRK